MLYLYCRRENDNKEKRINSLDSKLLAANKKIAKLELSSSKASDTVSQLTNLNKQLTQRNGQLVERFTHELSSINNKDSPPSDPRHAALKAQVLHSPVS